MKEGMGKWDGEVGWGSEMGKRNREWVENVNILWEFRVVGQFMAYLHCG